MPLSVTFDHPEGGGVVTHHNITKLEGVWCLDGGGKVTHYALYKGHEPYEHRRSGPLIPANKMRRIVVTGEGAEEGTRG